MTALRQMYRAGRFAPESISIRVSAGDSIWPALREGRRGEGGSQAKVDFGLLPLVLERFRPVRGEGRTGEGASHPPPEHKAAYLSSLDFPAVLRSRQIHFPASLSPRSSGSYFKIRAGPCRKSSAWEVQAFPPTAKLIGKVGDEAPHLFHCILR